MAHPREPRPELTDNSNAETEPGNRILWGDGRTPLEGRRLGTLALESVALPGERFTPVDGYATVFESDQRIVIGRFCSRQYLDDVNPGKLHWSKLSLLQTLQLDVLAEQTGRSLSYLFVSPTPGGQDVRIWHSPADLVERSVFTRTPNANRNDYDVVIGLGPTGRFLLYESDITPWSFALPIASEHDTACA